jgi:hypothetical protein
VHIWFVSLHPPRPTHDRVRRHASHEAPLPPALRPRAVPSLRATLPKKTPLHRVVSEKLESWLKMTDHTEWPVPGYVEKEFAAIF